MHCVPGKGWTAQWCQHLSLGGQCLQEIRLSRCSVLVGSGGKRRVLGKPLGISAVCNSLVICKGLAAGLGQCVCVSQLMMVYASIWVWAAVAVCTFSSASAVLICPHVPGLNFLQLSCSNMAVLGVCGSANHFGELTS